MTGPRGGWKTFLVEAVFQSFGMYAMLLGIIWFALVIEWSSGVDRSWDTFPRAELLLPGSMELAAFSVLFGVFNAWSGDHKLK
jgi:hypothetical protein